MSVLIDYSSGAFAANQAQGVGTITGSNLDISSGTYFNYTPSANTTFTFSNAPASGTAAGFALAVTGANVGAGYDIANASYDSVSFGLSTQETGMFGLFFKPDGTKMYTVGETNDNVYEYTLSNAWVVSSATYSQSFSISSQEDKPRDLFFKPDGTKMYVIGTVSDSVNEYDLSTAWDISTASFSQSASVSAQDARPNKMWFKPDGTQFYHLGNTSDDLYEYTLSSAWDVSTLSYVRSFNTGTTDNAASGIFFKPDGLTVFITGTSNDKIFEFSLSTAWNISTMSLVRNFSLSSQDSAPESTRFKDDGSKMYVLGATTDTVYQYTTQSTATATFSYPASVEWPSGTAPDGPAIGETDVLVFLTDDNGTSYQGFQAGDAMS